MRQDPGVDERDLRSAGGVDGDQHGEEVIGGGNPAHQRQPVGGHGAAQPWTIVRARAGRRCIRPPTPVGWQVVAAGRL